MFCDEEEVVMAKKSVESILVRSWSGARTFWPEAALVGLMEDVIGRVSQGWMSDVLAWKHRVSRKT